MFKKKHYFWKKIKNKKAKSSNSLVIYIYSSACFKDKKKKKTKEPSDIYPVSDCDKSLEIKY